MNLGIALFPEFSWRGMFDDRVSFIEIEDAPVKRDTYVYVKTSKYISYTSKLFREYLIEKFKTEKISQL